MSISRVHCLVGRLDKHVGQKEGEDQNLPYLICTILRKLCEDFLWAIKSFPRAQLKRKSFLGLYYYK